MCLIALAFEVHPQFPLIVVANRDEFYARPTHPAAFHPEALGVFAGRDCAAGGTWMGVARQGRFAALTNFRDPSRHDDRHASRGSLVDNYLKGSLSPQAYIEALRPRRNDFNPFNLLVADHADLLCYSSVTDHLNTLTPGIYGLSNHSLDTPWPKVVRARQIIAEAILGPHFDPEAIIRAMQDKTPFDPRFLPSTGVDAALEQALSSLFIQLPTYGTRSTTLMVRDRRGGVSYWEMTYHPDGRPAQMGVVDLRDDDFETPLA